MATPIISRDTVFVAGGQPSITYIERSKLEMERHLARAIAAPNQIVSLSGSTKCGKTVLCRRVLGDKTYVWVEGGQIHSSGEIWDRICYELNLPHEVRKSGISKTGGTLGGEFYVSVSGSHLRISETAKTYRINSMATALRSLTENADILVVDDFHYLEDAIRRAFLRNIKGAVFNGLRVMLLSVTHRAFDAIKAESELTGRFAAITVPEWSDDDLRKIAEKGFVALNISCPAAVIDRLVAESQQSPFLMQKFCWEICYDIGVDSKPVATVRVPTDFDLKSLFVRIAKDSGQPIYDRLVAGPQSRKQRLRRPLTEGGDADVYEVTLRAIAESGPKAALSYDEIRTQLGQLLTGDIPQKHEVTAALKHLSKISGTIGTEKGLDWDEDKRELNIVDPYLRFFLRWQIRKGGGTPSLLA